MKPPTKEMKLVCEQMGYEEWHGERKYPRYQILTIEDLLEKVVRAEIPERLKAYEGVGMKVEDKQDALPFDNRPNASRGEIDAAGLPSRSLMTG